MNLVAGTLCAALVTVAVSSCGIAGGGTELKAPSGGAAMLVGPEQLGEMAFVRMGDFYVCTTGDDEVSVTGVALADSPTTKVTGFRVTRAPQQDDSGESSFTQTSKHQMPTDLAASQPFRQTCDGGAGKGSTYLTIDTEVGTLPIQSPGLQVTYKVGDESKKVTLDADIVVCGATSGCPVDPDEDF